MEDCYACQVSYKNRVIIVGIYCIPECALYTQQNRLRCNKATKAGYVYVVNYI